METYPVSTQKSADGRFGFNPATAQMISANRPVRTRKPGGVGRDGETPSLTRLAGVSQVIDKMLLEYETPNTVVRNLSDTTEVL